VTAAAARAELIEDRGEAGAEAEFFRSREFLAAEGVTHTLRIETAEAELLAPLLVRPIGGGPERDAISPYGYPGLVPPLRRGLPISSNGAGAEFLEFFEEEEAPPPIEPAQVDFSATGLVSIFVRHRLGPPPLAGSTPRNIVLIADPDLPRKSRPTDRRQVRRSLDAGYRVQIVRGTYTEPAQRAGFLDVYEQTMRRTAAAPHYFFSAAYFDRILEFKDSWLALVSAPGGILAAASIATVSDGFLHYYLSGSADSHLRDSPMKVVVSELVRFAEELGLPLNLGGGISPGDALEEFKRGYANREEQWFSSEIICDAEKYERLSAGRDAGDFFPAYRAS
jgi:hypothetical protein